MLCFVPVIVHDHDFWTADTGLALLEATFSGLTQIPGITVHAVTDHEAIAASIKGTGAGCEHLPSETDGGCDVHGAWQRIRATKPEDETAFLLDFRNPEAPALLKRTIAALNDKEHARPLAAVAEYQDHPCQYFREHAVAGFAYIHLQGDGTATITDDTGTRVLQVQSQGNTISIPASSSLQTEFTTVSVIPFDEEHLLTEEACQREFDTRSGIVTLPRRPGWTGYVVMISSIASCNQPTIREWFDNPDLPWVVRPIKGTNNCASFDLNGTKITGRQMFPDIFRFDGHLLALSPEALERYLSGDEIEVLSHCQPLPLKHEERHLISDRFDYLEYQVDTEDKETADAR